jgi:hypothetical protein
VLFTNFDFAGRRGTFLLTWELARCSLLEMARFVEPS